MANAPDTSTELREWALKTWCELQKALEANWSMELELDPDLLKKVAFGTHCDAYRAGGLLELDDFGKWIDIFGVVETKDLASFDAIVQAFECGGPVVNNWIQNIMREVSERDKRRIEFYMEYGGLPPIPTEILYIGGPFF